MTVLRSVIALTSLGTCLGIQLQSDDKRRLSMDAFKNPRLSTTAPPAKRGSRKKLLPDKSQKVEDENNVYQEGDVENVVIEMSQLSAGGDYSQVQKTNL